MEAKNKTYKPDLLYPELSYSVMGVVFDVFSELGYGYKENQYQKAIEVGFREAGINHKKELPVKIFYKNRFITTVYLDFLVEDKIVLEIKQGNKFKLKDIEQLYNYLKSANLKLGLLVRFTAVGVKFKRIVNIK
ncbi:MAG: GxxExxY protein [Candidatus Brennerbacteria bacterium]|nr:GxxExxY protein [Parcubacteria group bacterium]MBI4033928.1 GxxExxY protein [Candidatus Brennerbacteria bacterium]